MWRAKKKLPSLTLVELVVAMAITLLLLGGAVSFFSGNSTRRDLESQGKFVATFIERARNFAVNPDAIDPSKSGENAAAYGVICKSEQSIALVRQDKGQTEFQEVGDEKLVLANEYKFETFSRIDFTVGTGRYGGAPVEVVIKKKGKDSPHTVVKVSDPGGVDVKIED